MQGKRRGIRAFKVQGTTGVRTLRNMSNSRLSTKSGAKGKPGAWNALTAARSY